ncbi:DUF2254 family protein [Nocardioides sp. Iso805N]|uniref:DUF2254 family protein n=1 Tax=Nocardioides sp. Iso805N TaxID=1283287 RepID=UPI0009D93CE8|nr:DUF2254 family protein [Nocardioides sp. Iso805N]
MRTAPPAPTGRLLHARRQLRAELAQVVCALVGLGLGVLMPRLASGPGMQGSRLVEPLMTLGIGVIGVVSLIYSLLFGVVQWSASSFSPRLRLFRGDPLVWRTFALAIGVFVYCAAAALTSADQTHVSVLVPGVAIAGVLATVALIRQLQVRAFLSLQLAYVLEAVTTAGRAVIEDVYPVRSAGRTNVVGRPLAPPALVRTVTWSGRSEVVQQLDLLDLIDSAAEAGALVAFRVGVGETVHEGTPIADIHGGDVPGDVVRRAVVLGAERSFDQDPMLAIRLLADIALRALSPAINDPATAIDAIEATDGLLRALARRDIDVRDVTDSGGAIRIRLKLPTWDDYLRGALADLVPPAAPFEMVLVRLRRLLENLAEMVPPSAQDELARLQARVNARLAQPL